MNAFEGNFAWTPSGTPFELKDGRLIWLGTFTGTFHNVTSGDFMDGTDWVCLGTTENLNGTSQTSRGYCIVTDPKDSNNKACATWTGKRETKAGEISGHAEWIPGCTWGIWKGLTGAMMYSGKALPGNTGYAMVEGVWQI